MKQKDIVDQLREWADNAEQQQVPVVSDGLRMAADEIERLIAERDEARQRVCSLFCSAVALWRTGKPVAKPGEIKEYARIQGWDCFKEEG